MGRPRLDGGLRGGAGLPGVTRRVAPVWQARSPAEGASEELGQGQ